MVMVMMMIVARMMMKMTHSTFGHQRKTTIANFFSGEATSSSSKLTTQNPEREYHEIVITAGIFIFMQKKTAKCQKNVPQPTCKILKTSSLSRLMTQNPEREYHEIVITASIFIFMQKKTAKCSKNVPPTHWQNSQNKFLIKVDDSKPRA